MASIGQPPDCAPCYATYRTDDCTDKVGPVNAFPVLSGTWSTFGPRDSSPSTRTLLLAREFN